VKDLRSIKGKHYLRKIIAEGEHERQDFKYTISDALKIARSISAFANNSGGRLLIGVKDNGTIAGVKNEEDIYVVEQAASLYCRPAQQLKFTVFTADDGLKVIRAEINPAPEKCVMAREADGKWHAYYRVADENIAASPLLVKAWRRKASATPALFISGESEKTLLDMISQNGDVSLHDYMLGAHLSADTATESVISLYAAGIIDFVFRNREFRITKAE